MFINLSVFSEDFTFFSQSAGLKLCIAQLRWRQVLVRLNLPVNVDAHSGEFFTNRAREFLVFRRLERLPVGWKIIITIFILACKFEKVKIATRCLNFLFTEILSLILFRSICSELLDKNFMVFINFCKIIIV